MRVVTLATTCALLAACFSKPANTTGGRDGGADASDATDAIDAPPRTITVANAQLAAGAHHACWIGAMSKLWCWGDNTNGQVGDIPETKTGVPVNPQSTLAGAWTAVAAGTSHTCGIHDGQIYCWGRNDNGQAGGNNSANLITLPGAAVPMNVFAGSNASCAIDAAGKLYCWGKIDPAASALTTPTQILPGAVAQPWAMIAPGGRHTCAIYNSDLPARCWGENTHLQLGQTGGSVALASAGAIAGHAFIDLSVSEFATCGVTADHELMCFGSSGSGHLGPYTGPDTEIAVEVGDGLDWTAVAMGLDHVCGIAGGKVYCYGVNSLGAMGNGFAGHRAPQMVTLPGSVDAAEIVSGHEFSCARPTTGDVSCWGVNRVGELGNGHIASSRTEVAVPLGLVLGDVVTQIATGDGHSCAVIDPVLVGPTIVKCWGDNRSRQVDSGDSFAETPRPSTTDVKSISAGGLHTCGVQTDGSNVRCWGSNQSAELGKPVSSNGTNMVGSPVAGPWLKVAAGSTASCAIAGTELHCWGSTPAIGMPLSAAPPTRVSNLGHAWSGIVLGSGFGAGIVDTVEVGGFGRGCPYGSMTMDYNADQNLPIATEPGPFQLAAAQAQGEHLCMHVGGTPPRIVCWGSNAQRQIDSTSTAQGCYQNEDTEAPVGGWVAPANGSISVAGGHSCAIGRLSPGAEPRLFCWGADDTGLLGFGPNNGGTPFKVNDLIVSQVSTAAKHTCVIAKANTLDADSVFCWGENRYGEVGNGYRFRDTPTPITIP